MLDFIPRPLSRRHPHRPTKKGDRGREYEDYVKSFINPPPYTTTRGIGFQLPNPEDKGKPVYFDDCQHSTGIMVEAKGRYTLGS